MNISVQAKCRVGRLLLSHDMDETMALQDSGYANILWKNLLVLM